MLTITNVLLVNHRLTGSMLEQTDFLFYSYEHTFVENWCNHRKLLFHGWKGVCFQTGYHHISKLNYTPVNSPALKIKELKFISSYDISNPYTAQPINFNSLLISVKTCCRIKYPKSPLWCSWSFDLPSLYPPYPWGRKNRDKTGQMTLGSSACQKVLQEFVKSNKEPDRNLEISGKSELFSLGHLNSMHSDQSMEGRQRVWTDLLSSLSAYCKYVLGRD